MTVPNVLVLAQHLDDVAESFLMSLFHGGRLQTMKAHYRNDAGDLRVIRPLIYARERQTREFAEHAGLPAILDNCPACFRMPTRRMHFKVLLALQEQQHKQLFSSLLTAMRPLLAAERLAQPPPGRRGARRHAAIVDEHIARD